MTFEEFKAHATRAISAFREVREIVLRGGLGERPATETAEIDRLQEEAATALGAIDHIIDQFGTRTCRFGQGNPEVDMFRKSLAITDLSGAAILEDAIAELRLLVARLGGRGASLPDALPHELSSTPPEVSTAMSTNKRVFLVHGHDGEAREAAARFLMTLGLEPVILHEQPTEGRTIMEKLDTYADVSFAVVLLTPDDVGRAKDSSDLRDRARQNVILELGYFVGRLGRRRVCAIYKGIELPSDMLGVVYVSYDAGGAWRVQLARELKAAGFGFDAGALL